MKFIKEVNEFISENFSGFKSQVLVNDSEQYMISVNGLNDKHSFTIDLGTNQIWGDTVALYGYGDDIIYDMNKENLVKLFEFALKIKQFGKRIGFNVNGEVKHAIEFIDEEPFTPERAKQIYREHRLSRGKWVLPCILECSNFDGSISFSVQVY